MAIAIGWTSRRHQVQRVDLHRTPHSLHLNSLAGSMALSIREPPPNLCNLWWVNSSPLYIVTAFLWVGVVAVAVTASQLSLVVEIGAEYHSRQCTRRILGTLGRTNTFSFRFQVLRD